MDENEESAPAGVVNREFIDDAGAEPTAGGVLEKRNYDPDRAKDKARAGLAFASVGILAAVILLLVFGSIYADYPVKDAKELLGMVLGPLVGFVGSATGFYYGAHGKSE